MNTTPPRRRSSSVKLWLIGGGIFAASACCCGGCVQEPPEEEVAQQQPFDPVWHDANGNVIEKEFKVDENGKRVPVQPAFDAQGKPIEFDENGNPIAPANYVASSTTSHTTTHVRRSSGLGLWPWFFMSRGGGSYAGGYSGGPSSGARPSAPSSGSVSRGGFGSTGGAHAGSAS